MSYKSVQGLVNSQSEERESWISLLQEKEEEEQNLKYYYKG